MFQSYETNQGDSVLVSAGIEFIFLVVTCVVLCFVTVTALITHQYFTY